MNSNSSSPSFMDTLNMWQQGGPSSRQAPLAQPRAVRPGSAGKLLAMDGVLHHIELSQTPTQESSTMHPQAPQTPNGHTRFGFSNTPHSIHRKGAPQALKLSTSNAFDPFIETSPYAPSAGLVGPTFAAIPSFSPDATNETFGFATSFPASSRASTASPRRRSHARQESQISVTSIQSNNSMFMPSSNMDFTDGLDLINASPMMTPPCSPKKRKSPSKSPQKAKDRPNYLDKAIMRDTGVTAQQINDKIGDPLPADPKNWRCMWDACGHVAARKENIRAHVQTHLGDRPFECPECHADFVRPHDFTRHYTTHVDSRDFRCPDCPQAFNRADALQRHRDRDFCNGTAPPGSPTKVKRALEALDRKKDIAGRRLKKQVSRKQAAAKKQESADSSDDWWSSSAESPDCMSSDPGTPDLILSDFGNLPGSSSSLQAASATTMQVQSGAVSLDEASSDIMQQLLAFNNGDSNSEPVKSTDVLAHFSLSPPSSPEEVHSQLTLKPFSPSRQVSRQKQNPTPPASQHSMLDFLNTGEESVASAPSLPDLSSAGTSPNAFEPVKDFDDFCNGFGDDFTRGSATPDWLDCYNTIDYRLSEYEQGNDFAKRPMMLSSLDTLDTDNFFEF